MLYTENDEDPFGHDNVSKAKLKLFATQTGMIGEKKIDVNSFLNIQIEEHFKKIEKQIGRKMADVKLMKLKVEKLEDENELSDQNDDSLLHLKKDENDESIKKKLRSRVLKTEMCATYKQKTKCKDKDCVKAHNPLELDLIDKEKKILNLQKTMASTQKKIEDGKPPEAWRPTSAKEAIISIFYVN